MPTKIKFNITPNKTLFPDFPSFEIDVAISGIIFKDYNWSCLPGYLAKTSGAAYVSDVYHASDYGDFYLYDKDLSIFDKDGSNHHYGSLSKVPYNYTIGSSGFAMISYGGVKVKPLLKDENEATLYSK